MTKDEVINFFDGLSSAAKRLQISPSAVSLWKNEPPRGIQFELEVITGGKLRANRNCPRRKNMKNKIKSDSPQVAHDLKLATTPIPYT